MVKYEKTLKNVKHIDLSLKLIITNDFGNGTRNFYYKKFFHIINFIFFE